MVNFKFQMNKQLFAYPLAFMLVWMTLALTAQAAQMYSEQTLYAEPSVRAEPVGIARLGEVEIIGQRQGFWVMIQTSEKIEGWLKVSHVEMEETEIWMEPIDSLRDTGRLAVSKKGEESSDER